MTHPVFQQLRDNLAGARGDDRSFRATCPACEEKRALSVSHGADGRVLLNCFANCTFASILAAVGLKAADLFVNGTRARVSVVPQEPSWRADPPPVDPKWLDIAETAYRQGADGIDPLAAQLGVSRESLIDLRIGFLSADQVIMHGGGCRKSAYAIPERNGLGQVSGIALRFLDGSKGYLRGGKRGIVIPASVSDAMPPILYAVEGMSDCAAILTVGQPAVARSSCAHGATELYHLLRDKPGVVPVIVGDRDAPGCEGAKAIQKNLRFMLKREVRVILPPGEHKDMREALLAGAL